MPKKKKEFNGKIEVNLQYPISIDGSPSISSVYLERLKTKHLKKFPPDLIDKLQEIKQNGKTGGIGDLTPVLQIMTGLSEQEMDEIDFVDLNNIFEVLAKYDFL